MTNKFLIKEIRYVRMIFVSMWPCLHILGVKYRFTYLVGAWVVAVVYRDQGSFI